MRLWRTYSYVFGKEMDVFTPVEALERSTRLRIPNSLGIYASFVPKNLKLERGAQCLDDHWLCGGALIRACN